MDRYYAWLLPKNLAEDDIPLARLSANIVTFSLAGVIALSLVTLADTDPRSFPILAITSILIFGCLILLRTGYLIAVRYLLSFIAWAVVSILVLLVGDGTKDVQILGYPLVILIATLLIGPRGALIFTILSSISYAGIMVSLKYGFLEWLRGPYPIPERITLLDAITGITIFIIISRIQSSLFTSLRSSLARAEANEQSLRDAVASLEETQENLEDLFARRTAQLHVSSEVGRVATAILDPNEIIARVVNLITDQFGYYYAAIFLIDEYQLWAELKNATGEAGSTLLARKHRLQIGGQSMVGSAIASRQAKIALDVGEERVRFDNPLLPDTRSEIALPLLAGGRVLGALDVQSTQEGAFGKPDIETLQNMANQVAVAIENARLYQESRLRLSELNRLFRREFRDSVESVHLTDDGITFDTPVDLPDLTHLAGEPILVSQDGEASRAAVPLLAGGQIIGVMTLKTRNRGWREDELAIITNIANQAAAALENARLVQESLKRANQERILNDGVARIRETLDVQTILETAVHEIRRSLNLAHVEVQLSSAEETVEAKPAGTNGRKTSRGVQK